MSQTSDSEPLVVGITGKLCAGKDAVCSVFLRHGFCIIDVDSVGHMVLDSHANEVISQFGPGVSAPDGSVDRTSLGQLVFSDPAQLALLESILHPAMVTKVRETIQTGSHDRYIINAAILHKMGLHKLCDWIVWVSAPFFTRLFRAMKRDEIDVLNALKRIYSQRKLSLQTLPSSVDSNIVRNRGNLPALNRAVEALLSSKGIR